MVGEADIYGAGTPHHEINKWSRLPPATIKMSKTIIPLTEFWDVAALVVALAICNGTAWVDAAAGYDPTDAAAAAAAGYDPAGGMADGNVCWAAGTAAMTGWVGGTAEGKELPWNGTEGGIKPTGDITGGVTAAGPAIPDGWK